MDIITKLKTMLVVVRNVLRIHIVRQEVIQAVRVLTLAKQHALLGHWAQVPVRQHVIVRLDLHGHKMRQPEHIHVRGRMRIIAPRLIKQ